MENLGKKVGFLKGLMAGMDYDTASGEGKLMAGVVDLLERLSDRVEALDDLTEELSDYVASIDEDVSELMDEQDDFDDDDFDDDDDDDFDIDDDDDDDDELFPGGEDKLHLLRPAREEEAGEDSLAGNLCPECHFLFVTSLSDAEGSRYICPNCKKTITPQPLTPENAPLARPVQDN